MSKVDQLVAVTLARIDALKGPDEGQSYAIAHLAAHLEQAGIATKVLAGVEYSVPEIDAALKKVAAALAERTGAKAARDYVAEHNALVDKANDFSDPSGRATALRQMAGVFRAWRDALLSKAEAGGLSASDARTLSWLTTETDRADARAQHAVGCI